MTRFKAMDSEQMIEMKAHRASQLLVPTTVMPLITIRTIYTQSLSKYSIKCCPQKCYNHFTTHPHKKDFLNWYKRTMSRKKRSETQVHN